jgi:hypothetical protein
VAPFERKESKTSFTSPSLPRCAISAPVQSARLRRKTPRFPNPPWETATPAPDDGHTPVTRPAADGHTPVTGPPVTVSEAVKEVEEKKKTIDNGVSNVFDAGDLEERMRRTRDLVGEKDMPIDPTLPPSHPRSDGAKTDPENEFSDLARVRRLRGVSETPPAAKSSFYGSTMGKNAMEPLPGGVERLSSVMCICTL